MAQVRVRCFAIGAIEQGNDCRYASAGRSLLSNFGKRLDGFRRVVARKLLDAVRRFGRHPDCRLNPAEMVYQSC